MAIAVSHGFQLCRFNRCIEITENIKNKLLAAMLELQKVLVMVRRGRALCHAVQIRELKYRGGGFSNRQHCATLAAAVSF